MTETLSQFLIKEQDNIDAVYIVDQETANNLKITLKEEDIIPLQYKNLIEDLLNITYERKILLSSTKSDVNKKILKIIPLEPIFIRSNNILKVAKGISYIDDSILEINESPFGEYSFGENRTSPDKNKSTISFSGKIAEKQLLNNLNFFSKYTHARKDDTMWLVVKLLFTNTGFKLKFFQLNNKVQPPTPPPNVILNK